MIALVPPVGRLFLFADNPVLGYAIVAAIVVAAVAVRIWLWRKRRKDH